jgi:L-2-hydroxyglutarate oxidase LhgO
MRFNNLVIGGGVIGLSVSKHLSKSTILIEKNKSFGLETSSRNSQVIHSGLYYPENTLKTSLCIKGRKLLYKYLNDKKIPFRKCTKWIVSDHRDLLQNLLEKATKLQIPCRFVSDNALKEEPNLLAKYAILLSETGILDAYKYMESLEADVLDKNMIQYNTTVVGIKQLYPGYLVQCKQGNDFYDIEADRVINCAGLYSATIAQMIGYDYKLYYAKGHYYKPNKILSNRLIYPLPDLHSLGLHLTVGIDGENLFGPDVYFQENLDYSFQGKV